VRINPASMKARRNIRKKGEQPGREERDRKGGKGDFWSKTCRPVSGGQIFGRVVFTQLWISFSRKEREDGRGNERWRRRAIAVAVLVGEGKGSQSPWEDAFTTRVFPLCGKMH